MKNETLKVSVSRKKYRTVLYNSKWKIKIYKVVGGNTEKRMIHIE